MHPDRRWDEEEIELTLRSPSSSRDVELHVQPRKVVALASVAHTLASLTLLDMGMFRMGHSGGKHRAFVGSS